MPRWRQESSTGIETTLDQRLVLWLAYHPWGVILGFILMLGSIACIAAWHNGRVEARCAQSRCPSGLTGKHVQGTGCLCVVLPLKE